MMNEERPFNSTEFYIYGIIPYDKVNGNYSLILKDNEDLGKMVALIIGSPEAQSIAIFLEGPEMDRPLTHDLFCNLLLDRSLDIDYVTIDSTSEDAFFATIVFSDGEPMDCRPSDAISIAIRMGSPIYIQNEIVDLLSFEYTGIPGMKKDEEKKKKKGPTKNKQKNPSLPALSLDELEKQLNDAIEKENYELAALVRDEISKRK